jgi:hypothetical protein
VRGDLGAIAVSLPPVWMAKRSPMADTRNHTVRHRPSASLLAVARDSQRPMSLGPSSPAPCAARPTCPVPCRKVPRGGTGTRPIVEHDG